MNIGCFKCIHAQWDADGCTCKITGMLAGDVTKGCKYREVKYGKWKNGKKSQVCSICGGWGLDSFAFCPHCGSEIKVGDNS